MLVLENAAFYIIVAYCIVSILNYSYLPITRTSRQGKLKNVRVIGSYWVKLVYVRI